MAVFSAYATLAEFRAWTGEPADAARDAQITMALDMASEMVAQFCNRDLSRGSATEIYRGTGSPEIFLRRTPVVLVSSVVDEGGAVEVEADLISIRRKGGSGFSLGGQQVFAAGRMVEVTYTAGYSPMPRDVVLATCIAAKGVLSAAVIDPNLSGESIAGVTSFSVDQPGAGALPRAAQSLLSGYILRYVSP